MKNLILLITLFSILIPRELMLNTDDVLSVRNAHHSSQGLNIDRQNNTTDNNSSREDITLFEWDFEGDTWNADSGWELTESSYNSETHSYLSPNTDATLNANWNVISDVVSLPALGDGEIMRFKFWLWGDMPDTDGNNDSYLDDYYQLSIMDLEALSWHASANAPGAEGSAYWCADEEIGPDGGYLDEWMQYLDTPTITVGDNAMLSADLKWTIESAAGAVVAGTCTDGWDAANVRISADGGATWALLEDPNMPYDFDCGYGWIYNDSEYDTGGSLNQVAAGWGDSNPISFGDPIDSFSPFSADLSAYAGQEVIVRFAFGSDPAYSTFDQTDMTGFEVDNIIIEDASGVLYGDDCDDSSDANTMIPSGEVWESMFYDYCDSTRPGGNGWEEYVPGLAFNGNALHDISHLAGKDVLVKFSSRYDADHDGGQGQGFFIDDFIIYKEAGLAGPGDLMAESGDTEAHLTWQDMNASGENEDFAFDNDGFVDGNLISMVDADAIGYAGTSFDFAGTSTIHTVDIYHDDAANTTDFRMDICPYGSVGTLFNTETAYDCAQVETSTLVDGWNTIDVPEWAMSGSFIIAHSFNSTYGAVLDETADGSHSYFSYQQSNGNTANWQSELSSDGSFEGEWGIRANVSYQGADVTYNVYRDGSSVATGIDTYMYTDTGLINNVEYTYQVSATYSDGAESDLSDSVVVTPQAQTVHEESHDDGMAESQWHPAASNNWAVVKYEAASTGEEVMRFKWYQVGSGGAMYTKIFADNNGMPGDELYSGVTTGGVDGWNDKDLSTQDLVVSGDFWVGIKTFATTLPMGVDTSSDAGVSMTGTGADPTGSWTSYAGNIMFRISLDSGTALSNEDNLLPSTFNISNAYPNPFNPSTAINIDVPEAGLLNVSVYNLKGQLASTIVNKTVYPGSHSFVWNASGLTSGLYVMSVTYNGNTYNQKVTLVK